MSTKETVPVNAQQQAEQPVNVKGSNSSAIEDHILKSTKQKAEKPAKELNSNSIEDNEKHILENKEQQKTDYAKYISENTTHPLDAKLLDQNYYTECEEFKIHSNKNLQLLDGVYKKLEEKIEEINNLINNSKN